MDLNYYLIFTVPVGGCNTASFIVLFFSHYNLWDVKYFNFTVFMTVKSIRSMDQVWLSGYNVSNLQLEEKLEISSYTLHCV